MTPADVHLLTMARAWAAYPAQYRTRFGEPIGTDYAIGPAWAHVGYALHSPGPDGMGTDPTAPARGRSRLLRMR